MANNIYDQTLQNYDKKNNNPNGNLPSATSAPKYMTINDIPKAAPLNLNVVPDVPAPNLPTNTLGFSGMQNLTNAIANYGTGVFNALNVANENKRILNARKTLSNLGINKAKIYKAISDINANKARAYENMVNANLAPSLAQSLTEARNSQSNLYNAKTKETNVNTDVKNTQLDNLFDAQPDSTPKISVKDRLNVMNYFHKQYFGMNGIPTTLGQSIIDNYKATHPDATELEINNLLTSKVNQDAQNYINNLENPTAANTTTVPVNNQNIPIIPTNAQSNTNVENQIPAEGSQWRGKDGKLYEIQNGKLVRVSK